MSYDTKFYANVAEAKVSPDGLAVVGVLFSMTSANTTSLSGFSDMMAKMDAIKAADSKAPMNAFKPYVLLPSGSNEFYRYEGSLTTPPCTQNVMWTVLKKPLTVSRAQVGLFVLEFSICIGLRPVLNLWFPLDG